MQMKGEEIRETLDGELKEKIGEIIEKTGLSMDEVDSHLEERYVEFTKRQSSELPEGEMEKLVARATHNDLMNVSGPQVQYEELPILTMGFQYRKAESFYTDQDAVVGLGIVNPSDDPAGLASFVIEEADGLDMDYIQEIFQPLNTIVGDVQRRRIGTFDNESHFEKGGSPTYHITTGPKSTFRDEGEFDAIPEDREEKRDLINGHFITEEGDDVVTIQNYAEHERVENASGYPLSNGIDVKRIRGEVANVYEGDGFGIMVVTDDTVFNESDVPDDLISEEQRTPGLQVFMDPPLLQYGEGSWLDVYGYVEQSRKTGQWQMSAFGAIPIINFEREDSSNASSNDDVEEDLI